MDIDKLRSEFEKWKENCGYNINLFESIIWQAYQAASKQSEAEKADLVRKCAEICNEVRQDEGLRAYKNHEDNHEDGFTDGCNECSWAILELLPKDK